MSADSLTTLLIVRHGETQWNIDQRIQGHLDSPLTDLGRRQTEAAARRLVDARPQALYSSDVGRCLAIAEIVARHLGIDIVEEPRLREWNLGIFEGLTRDEADARYPEETDVFRSRLIDYRIPQGESRRDKHARANDCLDDIARRHAGARVAIVTHGGVLDDIFRHTVGLPIETPRRYHIANAAWNAVTWDGLAMTIDTWNDTSHLCDIATMDGYLTTPNGARR